MPEQELKEALSKLVKELQNIDEKDEQAKARLKELIRSIEQKLDEPENRELHGQLLDKIKEEAIQYEVKHPLVSKTLEDIVGILVRLGI